MLYLHFYFITIFLLYYYFSSYLFKAYPLMFRFLQLLLTNPKTDSIFNRTLKANQAISVAWKQ